jgi:hypothetical protein
MTTSVATRSFRPSAGVGWGAALLEIEHQAEHWDTPEHGELGHLIALAFRAAAEIARTGGLRCEHRLETASHRPAAFRRAPDTAGWGRRAAALPLSRAG